MKRTFFASLCALLICISVVLAQNSTDGATSEKTVTLLVRVRSRHVDYFEACVPIRINEPFTIRLGQRKSQRGRYRDCGRARCRWLPHKTQDF